MGLGLSRLLKNQRQSKQDQPTAESAPAASTQEAVVQSVQVPPPVVQSLSAVSTLSVEVPPPNAEQAPIQQAQVQGQAPPSAKPLSYYEEQILRQNKKPWNKDYLINFVHGGAKNFDDFWRLPDNKRHRVVRVRIQQGEYIASVQFTYEIAPGQYVDGYKMTAYEGEIRSETTFELGQNEYITEIFGRYGLHIDKLGFRTNLDRQCVLGGEGGGPFQLAAPAGFYFSSFGVNCGNNLNAVLADIKAIPGGAPPDAAKAAVIQDKFVCRRIGALVSAYLTINDLKNLFIVSRTMSRLRFHEEIINRLATNAIFSTSNDNMRHIDEILHNHGPNLSEELQKIVAVFALTNNRIENPDSNGTFEGWKVVANGGDGIKANPDHFVTSYGYGAIALEKGIEELFSPDIVNALNAGKGAIVAGARFTNPGFGVRGNIVFTVQGENGSVLTKQTKSSSDISKDGTRLGVSFRKRADESRIKSVRLEVGGCDTCYWAGYYGARINGIFLRYLPLEETYQENLFAKFYPSAPEEAQPDERVHRYSEQSDGEQELF